MTPNYSVNRNKLSIVPILIDHIEKYPLMSVQDIYKLIYQAAMGPEHLITNKDNAYEKLCFELEKIEASSSLSLLEEIDPTNKLIRLNLSPFKERKGDTKKLFGIFYQTAITVKPESVKIKQYFDEAICLAGDKKIAHDTKELKSFFRVKSSQKFPPAHHSDLYRKTYHPAYRLISRNFLDFLQ